MAVPGPIVEVAYDAGAHTLDIVFQGGQSVRYLGVPKSKAQLLDDPGRRDLHFYEHFVGSLTWIDRSRSEP